VIWRSLPTAFPQQTQTNTSKKKQDSTERYESDKKEIVSTLAIATCLEK
jgi:hypothetical protein